MKFLSYFQRARSGFLALISILASGVSVVAQEFQPGITAEIWPLENPAAESPRRALEILRSQPRKGHPETLTLDKLEIPAGSGARTYFFYDGWNLLAEYTGDIHTTGTAPLVTLQRSYAWGTDLSGTAQGAGGVGGLLAAQIHTPPNAGVYYPTYDGNGNVSEYLNSTGGVAAHYEYGPFGEPLTTPAGLAAEMPFRFSTKYQDAETGLLYYGYRYYDPITGRWLSRDPIGENGGLNLYEFVANKPTIAVDRLGLLILYCGPCYGPYLASCATLCGGPLNVLSCGMLETFGRVSMACKCKTVRPPLPGPPPPPFNPNPGPPPPPPTKPWWEPFR